ncbi:dedicator of cytokinesis protein 3 [Diaphorina citri]|uniref:Dedicator of cytokinesis protein 3 n=1 Tax=Diaphorina citri TaxID=121845 RepID=A0A3Q0INC7_DIACI|nr:dedicator of cytokinesis protein 3 [Diaphorina citri]
MWTPTKYKKFGVAIYNWSGETQFGLPLEIGDTVHILEECPGWYHGFCTKNRSIKGIFPSTYIYVKPKKVENDSIFETSVSLEDFVVKEVTHVLREWNIIWKKIYVSRDSYRFMTLGKVMRELLEWRRQLLISTLTQDQIRELKLSMISKIDWGNKRLGLDLVPRCGAEMVDPATMSCVQLYQVHLQSSEKTQDISARGTMRKKEPQGKFLTHHLYLCMRDFGHHIGEDTEIYFSLYDGKKSKFLSERFLVKISKEGFSNYVEKLNSNRTIFTDLGTADLNKDIHVVAHIFRMGRMLYSESTKKLTASLTHSSLAPSGGVVAFKRPYGVAVLEIGDMMATPGSEEREFMFKVRIPPWNDLYLILERGEFEKGGKSTGKNIEVTVQVLDSDGTVLQNCLWGASGSDTSSEYHSMIIYHHNSPCWSEIIRLAVPIERYQSSHIRLEYRHCSTRDKADNKKLLGFSFARLMEPSGATLQDCQHELFIYRCEERSKLDPGHYLGLASTVQEAQAGTVPIPYKTDSAHYACSHKESVFIRTLLCSTKLTQNVEILNLLKWREHPEKIQEALNQALCLEGQELVKFLQDILDALFSMFSTEDGNSTMHSGLVFHVLTHIFSLLYDSKFEHFKPVMDAYIKNHFAAALVYKGLITSIQHCADYVSSTEKQEPIQKCFRSLEYVFKFIIESRLLFSRATGGQYEEGFQRDLFAVFNALNSMLSVSYDIILDTQIALLEGISAVYDELTQVLPVLEVAKFASDMLECLGKREAQPLLTKAKLECIKNLVSGKLFSEDESRSYLLARICKHLRLHLAHRDELKLCTEILSEILSFLYKKKRTCEVGGKVNNILHHDLELLCLSTLDMLIQTVLIIIDRATPVLGSLVACLIGLLQLLDESHYKKLWEELGDKKPLKDFLLRAFLVLRDLVKQDVFPPDWLVMRMVTNQVILTALGHLAPPLIYWFLDSRGAFAYQVWSNYFNLAVSFLTQPSLQLEKFSDVKREKIIEKYGDMRVQMGFQILKVWSSLGEHKINFIPSMVGPFLEVTLVPENELRKATLNIFFDMMECEQRVHGNFKQVESELIDKLDILISDNKGDDEYRQLFNTMEHLSAVLLDRVQNEDPQWKETGSAFISSVTRLLERLLDYRSVIQGDENRDKRMSCTVNLLNFYKNEINRKEMYLRYIYKLHDLHRPADNFTEAGFTLKLYADSLSWTSSAPLINDPMCQPNGAPEWYRKEQLYYEIISYFDKGKCWEKGIPLCKELADLYEKRLFDYKKLSNILQTQAQFCDNILNQLRPEPEYFRVGFYGLSFPLFVRNKVFVYRGLAYERMEAFTQRLQTEFPSANILSKNSPPSHTIQQSDVQYIQICNVKPLPERGPPCINPPLAPVPDKIAQYYQVNDVRTFQLDRPMHKGPIDKDNEFKSLWLERTIMTISSPLPGILRWFEVVESNVDLEKFVNQWPRIGFSRRVLIGLQGTIDANVMGGIAKYQQAFFTPEFARGYPQYIPYINRLHILILEQVDVLENGLVVHGQLAPPGVQPLHKRLQERFAGLRQSIRKPPTESIIHSPLPPVPDQYINAGYHPVEEGEDIYSRPGDLDLGEGDGEAPCLPQRPRSAGYGTLPPADKPKPAHQRLPSKSSVHKRQSSDSGFSSCTAHMRNSWSETYEEAPPLPPRGFTPDKRSSGEPPSLHRRQDSISQRDSSYSDNISVYEDCVVPNTSFLFSTGSTSPSSPCPPPLPPKVINSVVTSEETSHREVVTENYSVPKLQAGEETNQGEDSNVMEENNQTCDEN